MNEMNMEDIGNEHVRDFCFHWDKDDNDEYLIDFNMFLLDIVEMMLVGDDFHYLR